jgi:diguanylate cyclase (GGDEF)-like protein
MSRFFPSSARDDIGVELVSGVGSVRTDGFSAARSGLGTIAGIPLDELTPRVRALIAQQIDENELLAAALADMRAHVDELERLVDSDTLTPLPNRRRFLRELDRVVQHSKRYGTPAFVMFVDLDGLKTINDTYGHFTGDAALIHVAEILAPMLRTTDVIARIGGDEFGLLLEYLDEPAARDKAAKLAAAVASSPLDVGGPAIPLSVSIGLAEINAGDSPDAVLARADAAMYSVKNQARSAR